jgi:hypothetical protein
MRAPIVQEGSQTGDGEASSRDVQWVAGNQELDNVKVSAPSEREEDTNLSFALRRAGNVELYDCRSTVERKENKQGDGENIDWLEHYQETAREKLR